MAGTEKKFSLYRIELPAETATALRRLAELPETPATLKRLARPLATSDLKRLLRQLSPEEHEVLDEIKGLRRELTKKTGELQQLEEQLDHTLGGRWWDNEGGGFLVWPPSNKQVLATPTLPAPRAAVSKPDDQSAPVKAKVARQEWWDSYFTQETKDKLPIEYENVTKASAGICELMAKEEATIDGGAYRPRYIEALLRRAKVFPPARRQRAPR